MICSFLYDARYPLIVGARYSQIYNDNIKGKTIAILGDSISTKINKNAVEIEITESDVGIQLHGYLSYYDFEKGLTINGHSFTEDEIGTDVTFTPTSDDIGKVIGLANNFNNYNIFTWWEILENKLGIKVNPVCWSASSITSHEAEQNVYKTSYAWHDAQIRKCGIRIPGTLERIAPDIVIIYRGANDFSHSPYTRLTEIDETNFIYPENDIDNGNYSYTLGLIKTIQKIRQVYPETRIFICTLNVFKRVDFDNYPTRNGINSLPEYNNNIRKVADFMGCDIIELDKDGITFENCYSEGYLSDTNTPTHPTNKGHEVIAKKVLNDLLNKY